MQFSSGSALRTLPLLAVIATSLSGCGVFDNFDLSDLNPLGGEKYKTVITPDVPASTVYDQGLAKLANGNPTEASKKFTELGKQFPNSDWSRKALIMTTYAQYQSGDYSSAIGSADHYVHLYPKTPEAAYALYLQASSYYAQIPDIARDQDVAVKAFQAFQALVTNYPQSEYVEDAKFKMQICADQLAGKEMSIGRFYLTRHNYTAAINRFRNVLAEFQTTREAEEALYRLVEAYLGLGITDEAQTAAAVLGHNFPDSQWYKDAYSLLKGQGLDPKDNPQSWITKTFHAIIPS